ncbi:MAG: hypothetical protein KatS3mg084_0248 [Candidatus Dojkabacteria bacterium]|nr:MAG: hypothetical protein KatS3mg084_0248 [Candidatus Dojkabacteria bacterium]
MHSVGPNTDSNNQQQLNVQGVVGSVYPSPHGQYHSLKGRKLFFLLFVSCVTLVIVSLLVGGSVLYFNYYRSQQSSSSNSTQNQDNLKDSAGKVVINDNRFCSSSIYQPEGRILDLIRNSSPAVVTIVVKDPDVSLGEYTNPESRETVSGGTGFFISEDGLLITNQHVVCGASARDIIVLTNEDKTYSVSSVEVEPSQDIAILRVNNNGNKFPYLKFAHPDARVVVGQEVIAIGNPFGANPGSVTRGIISGIGRDIVAGSRCGTDGQLIRYSYEGLIQTDAAINSGNSGGPLLNMNGEVIGVNSAGILVANNIGYAIPHTTVLRILDRYLKNNNKIISPYLGIVHRMIDSSVASAYGLPVGAYVVRVMPSSPAAKADIRPGDIITKLGGYKIDFSLASTLTLYFEPGQKTTVEVYRIPENGKLEDGRYLTLEITVGKKDN